MWMYIIIDYTCIDTYTLCLSVKYRYNINGYVSYILDACAGGEGGGSHTIIMTTCSTERCQVPMVEFHNHFVELTSVC